MNAFGTAILAADMTVMAGVDIVTTDGDAGSPTSP